MKFATVAIATLALLAGAGADVRSYVKSCYAKADHDLLTKNLDAFEKLLRSSITSDFKYTEMGHSEDFDHMVKDIRTSFGTMQSITQSKTKILKVVVKGKTATFRTKRAMAGEIAAGGKSHKLTFIGNTTDVWVLAGKKWKFKSMTWSHVKMTMDGKPFNPTPSGPGGSK